MAREPSTDERVRRSVGRVLRLFLVTVIVVGGLAAWVAMTGLYTLQPGEAAVILRLGEHARTEVREGPHLHLPYPIEKRTVVKIGTVMREGFGDVRDPAAKAETAMQTGDNNIVLLEFVVRYRIARPFPYRYRLADQRETLRDAAQAAMREVVGRQTIDGVLSDARGAVEADAADRLQVFLDDYEAGLAIQSVELQEVQPPEAVGAAFDEVIAAAQDRSRAINEAEGYANEVLPRSRAEALEQLESAAGYREATIVHAEGAADRFLSLLAEYRKAPEITRKRLYLETMEEVLPDVEKFLIEPGTAQVLPYLPLGTGSAAPRRDER